MGIICIKATWLLQALDYEFLKSLWDGLQTYTSELQYIPRNMHTVTALLCFVVVIHWLIFPYPSGLLHWHCGNLTIAPVPAKQPWWIWINTSCEFIMNDCITTTKQSTTKPCAYFLGYNVSHTNGKLFLVQATQRGNWLQKGTTILLDKAWDFISIYVVYWTIWKHILLSYNDLTKLKCICL